MRILLVGDFSNVHATLAMALRRKGHEVCVMSNGDGWKNYPRDIDISKQSNNRYGRYLLKLKLIFLALFRLRGYDVVQYINPAAIQMPVPFSMWFYTQLRKHNKLFSFGCMGDDYFVMKRKRETMKDDNGEIRCRWVRYNDCFAGGRLIEHDFNTWNYESKMRQKELWQRMVDESDCFIVSPADTYYLYQSKEFIDRIHFINFPIETVSAAPHVFTEGKPIKILFGIQKKRARNKGSDQMLPWFNVLAQKYPERIDLKIVEDVPFAEYVRLLSECDIVVDQLFSICPAMNALESMKYGTIAVSGGEPEFYELLGENQLRPIVNLRPFDDENNMKILEDLIANPAMLAKKSKESIELVKKYFDADTIASHYIDVWKEILQK